MTWIKMDDKAPRHPKIAGLSDRAFRWWVQGLCYASEFLTDGQLPRAFIATVPGKVRAELCDAKLWIAADDVLTIHDYLGHQTSRASVEADREAGRKRAERSRLVRANQHRTFAPRNAEVRKPDTDTDTEVQKTDNDKSVVVAVRRGGGLLQNGLDYERKLQWCAYVGARLEVPHKLHSDLVRATGGASPDTALQAFYARLDEEIEGSGEAIVPDVFVWLRERWKGWAQTQQTEAALAKFMEGGRG